MPNTDQPFTGDPRLAAKPEQQSVNALIYIAAILFDIKQELVKLNAAQTQDSANVDT